MSLFLAGCSTKAPSADPYAGLDTSSYGSVSVCTPGDCNQNGVLDAGDPICIVQCLAGNAPGFADCSCGADCDCSGEVGPNDPVCGTLRITDQFEETCPPPVIAECGNGICEVGEDFDNCLQDCGCVAFAALEQSLGCGNWFTEGGCGCDPECVEAGDCCPDVCTACADDPDVCEICNNGALCPWATECGNGICEDGETADNCGSDCGCSANFACGGQAAEGCWCDWTCQWTGDCCSDYEFVCPSNCGDLNCDPGETAENCSVDCGCQAEFACGGQSADGCFCDAVCADEGDCCPDIVFCD